MLTSVAESLSLPVEQVVCVFCLFSSYPFAFILQLLVYYDVGAVYLRQLFIVLVGSAFLIVLYSWTCFQHFLLIATSYFLVRWCKKDKMGAVTTVYALLYLGFFHIKRMIEPEIYIYLTATTVTMLVVQKVTLYAYYVQDENRELRENNADEYCEPSLEYAGLLDYLSYCFFVPTLLTGPSADYLHFQKAVRGVYLREFEQTEKRGPNILKNTLKPLLMGLGCFASYVQINANFNIEYLLSTDTKSLSTFVTYVCYFLIYSFGLRCMFFATWYIVESQANLCYMGFGGLIKDKEDWSQFKNIDFKRHELAKNLKEGLDGWNIKTTTWLRKIIYDRVGQYRVFLTFFISAYWHGFYPHYYHTFLSGALLTYASRIGRKRISPFFNCNGQLRMLYDLVKIVGVKFLFTYHTLLHLTLNFRVSLLIWRKLYFLGHLPIAIILINYIFPRRQ